MITWTAKGTRMTFKFSTQEELDLFSSTIGASAQSVERGDRSITASFDIPDEFDWAEAMRRCCRTVDF